MVPTLSSDKFTSAKTTLSLAPNSLTTSFHPGACFRHQPHPAEAIHRTNTCTQKKKKQTKNKRVEGGGWGCRVSCQYKRKNKETKNNKNKQTNK
jgi:hypothetical protein